MHIQRVINLSTGEKYTVDFFVYETGTFQNPGANVVITDSAGARMGMTLTEAEIKIVIDELNGILAKINKRV